MTCPFHAEADDKLFVFSWISGDVGGKMMDIAMIRLTREIFKFDSI